MIGFLAKRKRGKDTACDFLVKNYGYTKKAFADPLKKGVQELFGFTDEQLYTEKKEEIDSVWGVSPRKCFQVMGTDVVRNLFPTILLPNIGKDFWVKRADVWYDNTIDQTKGLVVWSDVRFQNEVDFILKNGGIVVKIERPELDVLSDEITDNHDSELGIDNIDNYTISIVNDGTLEEFYDKIIENINTKF